ncbi:membrane dipeptidase [Sandaracinus amylolyticus]|uniref:membrane dipeptidase n=1 Tax=Sandaracinus amylolyticus TaxID=927083 RepID=UPI0012ECF9A4|nr:membrane dipeptidase [Sandaracinus amylolyticus]
MQHFPRASLLLLFALVVSACDEAPPHVERPPAPEHDGIHSFASGCYAMDATEPGSTNTRWLVAAPDGETFTFAATTQDAGARFTMRAADLGTYLFFDAERHYLVAQDDALARTSELTSDVLLVDDTYESPAEWDLQVSPHDAERFQLVHHATGRFLGTRGLVEDEARAAVIALYPTTGCTEFPELTLDAEGTIDPQRWDDGAVFGIVETHGHLFSNAGFGGGGQYHGAPFHRLGVEHALPSCEPFHGVDGRRDLIGFAFAGLGDLDVDALLPALITGMTPEANHATDGYPTFTDWPNSWGSATHQTMYYRWLERAWMAGLRLFVQHATSNSVLCEFMAGLPGASPTRYSCNDMVATERSIEAAYALERYVDAQSGGPGRGWFRIVTTPEDARRVIDEGKLAVILGIEVSNLFDCFLAPREGFPACDEAHVRAELDRYHELGVRAIFPVHKLDNAFSAGDGDRRVGQIGSFVNSGHWSSFVLDCPEVDSVFDHGDVVFGGLNMPREDYLAPPPNDMSGFAENPIGTLRPFLANLQEPPLEGDYCQSAGLTALGETLIGELIARGMIIEVDHLPRRAFLRAYEMLVEADYPAAGTHGNTFGGVIYELGGVSKTGLGRCSAPDRPGAMGDRLRDRVALIEEHGGYPAEGFGFDLNGFAGGPRPRFGEDSDCSTPQANGIEYPFESYRGDVTFTPPHLGERDVDFDTEGMLHIGLMPELIQDARNDGVTDEDLAPLFRSAEGYLRMWERAEARAAELRGE